MLKKAVYIFLFITVLIFSSLLMFFGLEKVNKGRLDLAEHYLKQSQLNADLKLSSLIKSDALSPTDKKKLEIATEFLKLEQPEKAEKYLASIRNEDGKLLLAEYYLLKGSQRSGIYLNELEDESTRAELSKFQALASKETSFEANSGPKTDLGRLMAAVNSSDYSRIAGVPMLSGLNQALDQGKNPEEKRIILAKFMKDELPWFSLNILADGAKTTDLYKTRAEIYAGLKNYAMATLTIKKAIELSPEEKSLYETGLEYASAAGDQNQKGIWLDQLNYLETISK